MIPEWLSHGKPRALGIATAAVAGLVAITPASDYVGPLGALCIGLATAILCYLAVNRVRPSFGYDDLLDAFGVHGIGGFVAAILTGVFAVEVLGGTGLKRSVGGQLGLQFIGSAATIVYCGVMTFVIVKILDATIGLRVDAEQEGDGLDLALHNERGCSP